MLPSLLQSTRFGLSALVTLAVAGCVIGFTWYGVARSTETQSGFAMQQADTMVASLAASYAEQISRQTLVLDQSLATMARDWEVDPGRFNLEAAREQSTILTGISRDMFLADESGIIRQSSVPDSIGRSVRELGVFRDAAEHSNKKNPGMYLGFVTVNPIMRQFHLDAARTLHHPDGSFAGVIVADYRVSAISGVFAASPPPGNGFAALIGLTDGKLQATLGATGATQGASVTDTPMFTAVAAGDAGLWVGPSASDAVVRIHAYRRIPGRNLAVVAGLDQREVTQPVMIWQRQARRFAGVIFGLTALMAALIVGGLYAGRRRGAAEAEVQANLAASHALAEVSRAHADAIERRLHATFAAVADGIGIFDSHLNLVEWNELFPERSGINASLIRTGMSMEEVLHCQAEAGYFGEVEDVEAEVDRRIALLPAGNFGACLSFQAAARVIELRCRPLSEGGFVALYTDVTETRQARQALWDTRAALDREQSARARFLDVIGFELNARTAALMRSIARLRTLGVPVQILDPLYRIGESLVGLANDAAELPRMEGGAVGLRPALIEMRPLLRDAVDAIQSAAQERGITVYQVVDDTLPVELIADADRLRQIVSVLLQEALRFAAPDTIWLLADRGEADGNRASAVRLTVRGFGTPIPAEVRARIFPTFDGVAVPDLIDGSATHIGSTGLGPAIARHLTALMGGHLHCATWSTIDGRTGNDFTLSLPPDLLPGQRGRAPGQAPAAGKSLHRTRILMVGTATGLRKAAATMLRRDGHMVDIVPTCKAAVQAMRDVPYDIAFIDHQLQDASVEVAIASIRDLSGPARLVPLIVLAETHEEADERPWRDSGADGVLAANPTLEDLTATIRHHVWFSRSFVPEPGSTGDPVEEFEDGIPILSAERIEELRANLPREELLEMVEECIADLFHRLPALRRSLATGATGAITAQTHAMVGMAGGYGMAVLEARLRAILTAVRAQRLETIDGAAGMVEADLTRAAAALRRTLQVPHQASTGFQT